MQVISPYNLENGDTYNIEEFIGGGISTNKYRGTIKNLNACTWDWHNVLEIGNMIEYINKQETNSSDMTSPTFPGNVFYVHVNTNATEERYWLFYKPVADYLMTTQVLRQRLRVDNETICGLYKQHIK
jgi:hypothetical protein